MGTTRYRWCKKSNTFIDKDTGNPIDYDPNGKPTVPQTIIHDIPPHMAPSGAYISGRKAMMDDCKAHGYVPWEKVSANPGGFTDPAIAKRNGKRVCEATKEFLAKEKAKVSV